MWPSAGTSIVKVPKGTSSTSSKVVPPTLGQHQASASGGPGAELAGGKSHCHCDLFHWMGKEAEWGWDRWWPPLLDLIPYVGLGRPSSLYQQNNHGQDSALTWGKGINVLLNCLLCLWRYLSDAARAILTPLVLRGAGTIGLVKNRFEFGHLIQEITPPFGIPYGDSSVCTMTKL